MSRLAALISGFVLTAALAGSAHAQSAKVEIEAASAAFEAAFNGQDAEAVAELYTEDAAIFPPEAPVSTARRVSATIGAVPSMLGSRISH